MGGCCRAPCLSSLGLVGLPASSGALLAGHGLEAAALAAEPGGVWGLRGLAGDLGLGASLLFASLTRGPVTELLPDGVRLLLRSLSFFSFFSRRLLFFSRPLELGELLDLSLLLLLLDFSLFVLLGSSGSTATSSSSAKGSLFPLGVAGTFFSGLSTRGSGSQWLGLGIRTVWELYPLLVLPWGATGLGGGGGKGNLLGALLDPLGRTGVAGCWSLVALGG